MREALPATHATQHGHGLDCSLTTTLHSLVKQHTIDHDHGYTAIPAAITIMSTGLAAKGTAMATSTTVAPLQLLPQLQAHMNCEEVLCAIC